MRPLLRLILAWRGCRHFWQAHSRYEVTNVLFKQARSEIYLLRCRKCGDMKSVRVDK